MTYMATWGPKGFIVSDKKIAVLQGLSTSFTLKEDSENDTSGTQPTNTRGRELQPMNFSVTYMAAAGVDPRAQIEEWNALLGESYPLMIGGQRFGPPKMKLKQVSVSDVMLTNSGGMICATVSISLEEFSDGKTSKLLKKGDAAAAAKAAEVYNLTVESKKAALNATASADDRAKKKTNEGAMIN